MKKFDFGSFISNIIAVVLGIFITFGIQGLIDRRVERKEVLSALELVREELESNKDNLEQVIGLLAAEKEAAEFLCENAGNLREFDEDTVKARHVVLFSEMFFTVTDDALELLNSSSLFQKINDNALALGIIRAYDYLDANARAFNLHEKYKMAQGEKTNTVKARKAAIHDNGLDFYVQFYSSEEAVYFLKSVIGMADDSFLKTGLSEIDATIADIEARLKAPSRLFLRSR